MGFKVRSHSRDQETLVFLVNGSSIVIIDADSED